MKSKVFQRTVFAISGFVSFKKNLLGNIDRVYEFFTSHSWPDAIAPIAPPYVARHIDPRDPKEWGFTGSMPLKNGGVVRVRTMPRKNQIELLIVFEEDENDYTDPLVRFAVKHFEIVSYECDSSIGSIRFSE